MKQKLFFTICTVVAVFTTGHAQLTIMKGDFLRCAGIQAVSGYESEFRNYIKERIPYDITTEVDNMGNLIAHIGEGKPEIVVLTSIDEPGYVVSAITDDGYLRVRMVSSPSHTLFHQFYEGHPVDIMTDNGMIKGVVSIPSSHITRNKTEIISLEDFYIDIGARSKDEAVTAGINILDRVTAVKDFAELTGNRIAGPSLSSKFPAFAMLEALKSLRNPKNCLFVWATQGLRRNAGSIRVAEKYKPEKVIIVKAFLPQYDRRTGTRISTIDALDGGVLIPKEDSPFSNELYNTVIYSAAQQHVQTTQSGIGSINEARAFQQSQVVPIGIPVKYSFSLVEVIDLEDLEQLVNLIKTVVTF